MASVSLFFVPDFAFNIASPSWSFAFRHPPHMFKRGEGGWVRGGPGRVARGPMGFRGMRGGPRMRGVRGIRGMRGMRGITTVVGISLFSRVLGM